MLLDLDDFTGKYELHTGMYDQAKLLEYIQIYEEQYLIDLFGATLYDDFINDLDNNNYPESPNFQKVFDPFHLDNTSNGFLTSYNTYNSVIISKGILDMLKGFIYFEYVKDTANQITSQGQKIPQGENSLTATTLYNMMYTRYWEALKTYRAIQWYIYRNQDLPIGAILTLEIMNDGDGYDGYDWITDLTGQGSGTDGILSFTSWQINGVKTIQGASVGSGYVNQTVYPTTGGLGNGCTIRVGATQSGIPSSFAIVNPGTGYAYLDNLIIQGGNNDQDIDVLVPLGNGELKSLIVQEGGKNYQIGDIFVLNSDSHPNTGSPAVVEVTKVSIGDFTKWNGVAKQMAYWL